MIPDYQTLMLPVLKLSTTGEITNRDAIELLAAQFDLSDEEREQLLPSGKQRTFDNRVNWAKSYLKKAGLLTYPKRGTFTATDAGKKIIEQNPDRIDNTFLSQFESFQEFQGRKGTTISDKENVMLDDKDSTPDEILRAAHKKIDAALALELLDRVRCASPQFFEELIVELLLAMGYGGTSEDAARALGQSGDNGIDGVVDQDPLGVDQIYVQAKRYAEGNNVAPSDIRDFFGALNLKKAQKGLFFTTSAFSASATRQQKTWGCGSCSLMESSLQN